MKQPDVSLFSLIVPAYNQEKTIVENVKRLQLVLGELRYPSELIVVVDGKNDKTTARLRKAKFRNVKVLSYPDNRGKSYAIRFGMSHSKGDYVMFIDAGLDIDVNGISMLLEHMQWYEADVIVGSKRHPASLVNYTWQRKILSYGYYWFVKILFGVNVKDTQAGIKIFRRPVLVKILPRLVEKRFAGDLEMLVVTRHVGFRRIFEAPIKIDYELSSLTSAATVRSVYGIFMDTLAIFYRLHFLHYYDRIRERSITK